MLLHKYSLYPTIPNYAPILNHNLYYIQYPTKEYIQRHIKHSARHSVFKSQSTPHPTECFAGLIVSCIYSQSQSTRPADLEARHPPTSVGRTPKSVCGYRPARQSDVNGGLHVVIYPHIHNAPCLWGRRSYDTLSNLLAALHQKVVGFCSPPLIGR